MIEQLTNNNNEIEYYYNIGSIHGDIRMMLSKYVYNDSCFNEIVTLYENKFGKMDNVNYNFTTNIITLDIKGDSLDFQNRFAHCMYCVIRNKLNELNDLIDLFERNNPKYGMIKDNIDILLNDSYYITLFRTSFIKHKNSTSCIIQL